MIPLISLITPVYNTKESWLEECLESVLHQTLQDWELCLCDNGSEPYISEIIAEYCKGDHRIRSIRLPINQGGYKGLEMALALSSGQYVGLLDSDDVLPEGALEVISQPLVEYTPDVLYTDEVITDVNGNHVMPFIKPSFNRALLCFLHYWGHLTLYESALIKRLGIRHCDGSYDYDLALRASEVTSDIYHIPHILYYYRTYPESTSATTRESCMLGGLQTLQRHLDLEYKGAIAVQEGSFYKVKLSTGEYLEFPKLDMISDLYPNNLIKSLFSL